MMARAECPKLSPVLRELSFQTWIGRLAPLSRLFCGAAGGQGWDRRTNGPAVTSPMGCWCSPSPGASCWIKPLDLFGNKLRERSGCAQKCLVLFGISFVWSLLQPHRTGIKAANGFLRQSQGQHLWIWFSSQRQLGTKEEFCPHHRKTHKNLRQLHCPGADIWQTNIHGFGEESMRNNPGLRSR